MLYIYADINSGYHLTGGFTEDLYSGWVWLTQGTNKVPACPVQSPGTKPHDDGQKCHVKSKVIQHDSNN